MRRYHKRAQRNLFKMWSMKKIIYSTLSAAAGAVIIGIVGLLAFVVYGGIIATYPGRVAIVFAAICSASGAMNLAVILD